MDFEFASEENDIIDMIREFCIKEIVPIAAETDEEERFPIETLSKLAKMGIMGLTFPKEYGGAGMSNIAYTAVCEEIAKYCASTTDTLSTHCSLCCWPINEFGTAGQKKKYLAPLTAGEHLGAFGLTEPSAGTDAAMQKTTAVAKGDHWLINGSKMFITNGGYADTFIIFAMTDKEQGYRGISAFIVEKGFAGFSHGKEIKKMGLHATSTCEIVFEDMLVPKENLLGEQNKGFKIALASLDGGRIGIAAQAVGIAQGAINESIRYVKERVQFGKPISAFQNTQFRLAEMQTQVDAARLMTYRAADAKDKGRNYTAYAAMAKLMASDVANVVTRGCVQFFGGYGYAREYNMERMMRDAKITEIYEGTSEAMKMVISGTMGIK